MQKLLTINGGKLSKFPQRSSMFGGQNDKIQEGFPQYPQFIILQAFRVKAAFHSGCRHSPPKTPSKMKVRDYHDIN